MANVAIGPPFAINATVVAEVYYKVKLDFWFDLVLVLATQVTGFGLAGVCRRFLVWPASMVWPQNLVACTLLNTLHAEEDEEGSGISRFKYFMYLFGAVFLFYFLPGTYFLPLLKQCSDDFQAFYSRGCPSSLGFVGLRRRTSWSTSSLEYTLDSEWVS